MLYQVNRLEKRAALAELRRDEVISRHAAQIENSLFPTKLARTRNQQPRISMPRYGPTSSSVL